MLNSISIVDEMEDLKPILGIDQKDSKLNTLDEAISKTIVFILDC